MNLKRCFIIIIFCLSAIACNTKQSANDAFIEFAQESIKRDAVNSQSLTFRNQSIRNFWNKDGARLKIYCAEVNGDNRFGGRTGYQYVWLTLDIQDGSENVTGEFTKSFFEVGKPYIDNSLTSTYYLYCVRSDVERENLFMLSAYYGQFDEEIRAAVDRNDPKISDNLAPEDR